MTQLSNTPPATVLARRGNPFDKENISQTLAAIGSGLLSSNSFTAGLGAAAQNVAGIQQQLRDRERPQTTFGGPGGQFEITTDAYGNRSYRRVPEFRQAAEEILRGRTEAPDPKLNADMQSRLVYAVSQLPQEEQAKAWADILANPKAYNVNADNLPTEWNPLYGKVAGSMGLSVNQAETLADRGVLTSKRVQKMDADIENNSTKTASTVAKNNSTIAKNSASANQPKTKSLSMGQIVNGFRFKGGDPKNRANWEKAS